jgi:hypothetical protein
MPINLENQFIADTYKSLLHIGDVTLTSGTPQAMVYSGDGFSSSLTISTVNNGIRVTGPISTTTNISAVNSVFQGTLRSLSQTINGDSNISGNVTIAGRLSSASHILKGDSDISGNVLIGGGLSAIGVTTLRSNCSIAGNTTIGGTLSSASHTVNGNSTVNGRLVSNFHTVNGNSDIRGDIVATGSLSASNTKIVNRIDTNVIRANTYENLPKGISESDVAKLIFPINSIYFTFTSDPPNALSKTAFAGTEWEQIARGSFIMGVGSRTDDRGDSRAFNSAGSVGGEWAHELSTAGMPSHKHGITLCHEGGGSHDREGFPQVDYSGPNVFHSEFQADGSWNTRTGAGNPIHSTGGGSKPGFGAAHNNTPPGFALWVWRRVK